MNPIARALVRVSLLPALLAGLAAAPASAAAPTVPVVVVGQAAAAGGFEIDASLQALRQSTVAAQVSGNVLQLAVKAGDRVRAGQLIARIDERDTQAGLQRSEAGVAQAEAEWRNASLQLERTRGLRAQGFISQAALDLAESQAQAAQAGLAQARAARSQAALARGFAAVTAPFDAVVQATHVEAGDLASAGRPIATLYAPGALRAVLQLPASLSAAARAATGVEVVLPDGRRVVPVVRTELPAADAISQTVEWRLDLPPQASAGLSPGRNVRVLFAGAPAAAAGARLSVPVAALLRRGELSAVYVQRGEGFVLQAVRAGARVGDAVEVLAGLKPGERVAADAVRAGLAGAVAAK
ncbi:efflux transporter periplasmic adaptor subunit [Rubrivivax gelatinosus]|uniref:efflux RND transporter periplasmic adaptor subunit n=1 Tax=Rubrivivax gelatinosus TaxID=28068 RepID=UPI0019089FA7|nr:efflux RND transporter periplasmic adaptor subunit [Rubrivivax gelatinosus]MBK1614408.1 efflux transporter periplasmic adaptor subunit [Rubrivivax gelatinosus]